MKSEVEETHYCAACKAETPHWVVRTGSTRQIMCRRCQKCGSFVDVAEERQQIRLAIRECRGQQPGRLRQRRKRSGY